MIRTATTADLPVVRDLLVATWHSTYDAIYGADEVTAITNRWHSIEALARQLADEQSAFLVAEISGAVIGTAYVRTLNAEIVELSRLYVLPSQQGMGAGKAMLLACARAFPQARIMRLEVEPRNLKARHFYPRFGFAETDTGAACGGDPEAAKAALVMEAVLPITHERTSQAAQ